MRQVGRRRGRERERERCRERERDRDRERERGKHEHQCAITSRRIWADGQRHARVFVQACALAGSDQGNTYNTRAPVSICLDERLSNPKLESMSMYVF